MDDLLDRAARLAKEYLDGVSERPVGVPIDPVTLHAALDGPLPDRGEDPIRVVEDLARDVDKGLVATNGPRYFGFVIGGSLPVTVATSWLSAAWDQNAADNVSAPAVAVVEEVAGTWLKDLFGLPPTASVGFVTGGTMANFTGLAAGRHAVLRDAGWNVEADGLFRAPEVHVLVGAEAHATIAVSLRMLGLGADRVTVIDVDDQGRMRPDALRAALAAVNGPTIVCAQAGNVNSGAFDPLRPIGEAVREHGGWLHVDGAFGLWAAASNRLRPFVDGIELAHSWATDAHKTLNAPHDCGIVFTADPEAHRAAMNVQAAYLVRGDEAGYSAYDWVPESSRAARGLHVYAALRTLGRAGVAALIERYADLAHRMAQKLAAAPGVEILNEVTFTQVVARFHAPGDDDAEADRRTRAAAAAIQLDGTCWLGTTAWRGRVGIRVSVSNASTTAADIDRSAEAILRCAAAEGVPT